MAQHEPSLPVYGQHLDPQALQTLKDDLTG